jgi:2-haloalkanoic acid dehalogenase type II
VRLRDFKVLTFDCYGTLIDWEAGLFDGLRKLVAGSHRAMSRDQALAEFGRHEFAQQQKTPAMPYSHLLAVVYRQLAEAWGIAISNEDAIAFGASIPAWPEFPDSTAALQYLKRYYKLVILSNVDRVSFRASNARLKVDFDAIYTAQDIGSYKPSDRNFEYLIRRLAEDFGFDKADVLHVAQSLLHDHAPANRAALASAWIDRRHAAEGWGATMAPSGTPHYDFRFESLAGLATAHATEEDEGANFGASIFVRLTRGKW